MNSYNQNQNQHNNNNNTNTYFERPEQMGQSNQGMYYFNTFSVAQLHDKIAREDGTLDQSKIMNIEAIYATLQADKAQQHLQNLEVNKNWSKQEMIEDFENTVTRN